MPHKFANKTFAECATNHLTSFAVLVDVSEDNVTSMILFYMAIKLCFLMF